MEENMKEIRIVKSTLKPDKKGRALIMPMGDIHLGHPNCDVGLLKEKIEMCLKKNIYVIGMGDMIEASLRDSVGDGIYFQKLNPKEQIDEIIRLFYPLANKGLLLGIHLGNHENRITKTTSLDVVDMICNALNVPYLGHSALHEIKVGNQIYTIFSTHGSSGARLATSKLKAASDLFRYISADIVLHGHLHSLDHLTSIYFEVVNGKGIEKERHVIVTGSFLSYVGSYAEQMNLPPAKLGTALIYLWAKHNEIRVSL